MIKFFSNVTVARGTERRESVRTIKEEPLVVSVDFWAFQTRSKPEDGDRQVPPFYCSATFFGKTAELARMYLTPGRTVELDGYLEQTITEKDGRTYVNNEIRNATFNFLPRSAEATVAAGDGASSDDDAPFETTASAPALAAPTPRPTSPPRPTAQPGAGLSGFAPPGAGKLGYPAKR